MRDSHGNLAALPPPARADVREGAIMQASDPHPSNGVHQSPSAPQANGQSGIERVVLLDVLRGKLPRAEAAGLAGLPESAVATDISALLAAKIPPANLTLTGKAGVQGPVRIVRDATGTPHIYADHARDLFVGYGFALAQDRLWQIDYYRRRALGRLAEILGPSAVASDRRHRIIGFGRLADQEIPTLSAEAAEALDGFTAGINAWIDQAGANPSRLPVEFEILEYTPEPWTPRDSIALMRAFFWQLTGRLDNLAA
ncbi:MAG: penicillin acylase family protein, partial [Gemmataceae bacterium]|nr:penicillin acylase family protein [Gemmataceae bacterium]